LVSDIVQTRVFCKTGRNIRENSTNNYLRTMSDTDQAQLYARIEQALDTVRPHLRVDQGDVELVGVTDDMRVQIRWTGMCESCSMSAMTLRAGLSEAIKNKIPEIVAVEAVNGVGVG
jgi:Fe-S cluster biogenesis protein NfuA